MQTHRFSEQHRDSAVNLQGPAGSLAPAMQDGGPLQAGDLLLFRAASLAAIVFISVGIRRPLFTDEAWTILTSSHDLPGVLRALTVENNQPAYFLLLSLWMRIFGDSEVALRLLSAAFYVIGAIAAGWLAKRVATDRRSIGYTVFFYICSAQAIHQAQNIRMYALLGLLSGVSTLSFLDFYVREQRSWRTLAWYIGANALGLLTHIWFGFVILAQAIALIACASRKRWSGFVASVFVSSVPFVALWAPQFVLQVHNGATDWMPPVRALDFLDALLRFYGIFPAILLYAFTVLVLTDQRGAALREIFQTPALRALAIIFFLCLILPLLVSILRPIYWPDRYTIIALPALAVLLGTLFARHVPQPLLAVVCSGLLGMTLVSHVEQRDEVLQCTLPAGSNDRVTADYLLRHAAPGDSIIFTSLTRAAADYYFRRAGASGRFVEISYPAELARHLGSRDIRAMLSHPEKLQAEATGIVEQLKIGPSRRIWVYYGADHEVSDRLVRELDRSFSLEQELGLRGPFHTAVRVYRPAPVRQSAVR